MLLCSDGSCSSESSRTTRASRERSIALPMRGAPLFPPSSAGWTVSAARICAIRLLVVVFPFVPVIPTRHRAPRSRMVHSGSLIRIGPLSARSEVGPMARSAYSASGLATCDLTVGKPSVTAGLCTTRSAVASSGARSAAAPNASATLPSENWSTAAASVFASALS